MNFSMSARVASFLLAAAAACSAHAAPPAAVPVDAPERPERGEPAVAYTVIEDEGSRIDELKVRGQTKRITVTPKGRSKGLAPYEIIAPTGSQDLQEAPTGGKGAAGKRVWRVLSF